MKDVFKFLEEQNENFDHLLEEITEEDIDIAIEETFEEEVKLDETRSRSKNSDPYENTGIDEKAPKIDMNKFSTHMARNKKPEKKVSAASSYIKDVQSRANKMASEGTLTEINEASKEGTIRVVDLSNVHPDNRMGATEKSGYQVQRMTKGKFVNQGKPYKKYADAKKVQQGTGQHSMQFEEISGTGYELYHRDFSGAMGHAYAHAKKKFGITVDSDEIDDKVAMGPRKPGNGKTNTYRLKGDKGNIQVQVYNRGGSKPFELNMYKESVIEDAEMIIENVSPKQIAMLKKQYSSMPDRLPLDQAMKMSKMVAKFDKASLMKVAKADIKWLSSAAKTNLISKHGATAKDFKESVELDEATDFKSTFDGLKKGDIVKIKYGTSISKQQEGTFKVTFKSIVGKEKVGKITLVKQGEGAAKVKHYLYDRNGKVSMAMGDMGASMTSLVKESILEDYFPEKLTVDQGLGSWISDFAKSDAPALKGKSAGKRKSMAYAAFKSAQEK